MPALNTLIKSYQDNTDPKNPAWRIPSKAIPLGKLITEQWAQILSGIADLSVNIVPTEGNIIYVQGVASDKWIIGYTRQGYPTVTVTDTTGRTILAAISYISLTQLQINFARPTIGTAILKF